MKDENPVIAETLLHPDHIMTKMHQALHRDLEVIQFEYNDFKPLQLYTARQTSDFLKKYVSPGSNQDHLVHATYEKFFKTNQHMSRFRHNLPLPVCESLLNKDMTFRDKVLLRARSLLHATLGHFDEDEWFLECKNSGGTTVGVSFFDTSPEAKFTYPITATKGVETTMERYFEFDSSLNSAVEILNRRNTLCYKYQTVSGSRGTTVEKSDKIRRMIAVEPTANMFLQEGLMQLMYKRMKLVGLDVVSLPSKHVQLAREGSTNGLTSTIDFSSASDCVSPTLLEWLLPPKWFWCLNKLRSRSITILGEEIELNMFSTMGNATTFPCETLVFWALGVATISVLEHKTRSLLIEHELKSLVSVFGDDCILPTRYAEAFMAICESVGFIVNHEKSCFDHGPDVFRESCGGDFLSGYDVRPVCPQGPHSVKKSSLEPWLYTIINLFLKKHISCFGNNEVVAFQSLFKTCLLELTRLEIEVKLVPDDFPDDAGLKVSWCLDWFFTNHPGIWSPLHLGSNGTRLFRYCQFNYSRSRRPFGHLRYCLRLKGNQDISAETFPGLRFDSIRQEYVDSSVSIGQSWIPLRRIGGYVVSKAATVHWTVPLLDEETRLAR